MSDESLDTIKIKDLVTVLTDYVANGSFASLRENVKYQPSGFARLIRLVDYNKNFSEDDSVWVDEHGYNFLKKSKLLGGEIIVSNVGEYAGKAFICPELGYPMTLAPNSIMLKTRENDLFYYYYFISEKGYQQIRTIVSSSGQPKFNKTNFKELEIPHFPIKEQDSISALLKTIDDKISTNDRIIRTSERLIREIYDYWFVQFDFPDEKGRPYKSSGGKMVFNKTIKQVIPEKWSACNILDVVDWVGGAQPPKSTFIYEPCDGYIRFIQNRDYADDNYKTWIPESRKNKVCNKYDIMMDKYGDAGRIRFGLAGAYNVALAKIAVSKDNLREYIRSYLSSEPIYQYLYNACIASTRASLNEDILGNLNICIPEESVLDRYNAMAKHHIELTLTLTDENNSLLALRNWLLPLLMSRQVKVAN